MSFARDLDTALLELSPNEYFRLVDAVRAVLIWGAIGSGKTTGSGKALASAYLRAGMGGIVLCAKPEEVDLWLSYCKDNGRADSVILFDGRQGQGYNFCDHELARQGAQGLGNVAECILRVIEASDAAAGSTGHASDEFWSASIRQILSNVLPVLYSAWGKVTVSSILDFAVSAATKPEQYVDPAWSAGSYAAKTLRRAIDRPAVWMADDVRDAALKYWFHEYTAIPEKTRGNIQVSLTTKLNRFRHGRMRSCFCDKTTIVPEMTFGGSIIILAMPALTWNEDGIVGQQLFKYMWQRAVESRNGLAPEQRDRPVFLWADEAQYFVNVKDEEFLSTCRGSRACVVFLTQNFPSFFARFGKDMSDAAEALIGKFNTQVFHLNSCNRTNTYASQLIGRGMFHRANQGRSFGTNRSRGMNEGGNVNRGTSSSTGSSYSAQGGGGNSNSGNSNGSGESWGSNIGAGSNESRSWGTSEQMDNLVESNYFATQLKSGGPAHGNKVTAVWFKAGAAFSRAQGGNFLRVTFKQ